MEIGKSTTNIDPGFIISIMGEGQRPIEVFDDG